MKLHVYDGNQAISFIQAFSASFRFLSRVISIHVTLLEMMRIAIYTTPTTYNSILSFGKREQSQSARNTHENKSLGINDLLIVAY